MVQPAPTATTAPMRVCMVLYDFQDFGGLEEYVATLAIGLRALGHETSVLSCAWVSEDNQYRRRLVEQGVPVVDMPRWISRPASDWDVKMRILGRLMRMLSPVSAVLAAMHMVLTRGDWSQSLASARGWVSGRIMRCLAPDRRPVIGRWLLAWWRLRWRPDLLHVHGYTTNLLFAVQWAQAQRVPVVYEEHQTPDPQFDWWRGFSDVINKASAVLAVSERSALALETVCGVTRPIVIRPPLLPDPVDSGWQLRNRHHAGTGGPMRITTVARLYVTKGLTYLLEAIAQIRSTHPDTDFKVYGDGPLRAELCAYARRLNLDPDAIFPGAFTTRDALGRILAETDIFVLSSILEGQPLSILEAMAYGCPIVTTSVGGIPELIEDGVNGLLCEPADPQTLADAIRRMIDDPVLREHLGRQSRRSFEQGPYQPLAVCAHLVPTYSGALASGVAVPASS